MPIAIIQQYFGLGDCIFSQGVASHFIDQGYRIVWPVWDDFCEGLSRAYPDMTWLPHSFFKPELFDIKEEKILGEVRLLPISWSNQILNASTWMHTKYDLYGLDYHDWKKHASYQRDPLREQALMAHYGIRIGEPYNLANSMFRTNASGNTPFTIANDYKTVQMQILPEFSLFDYSLLIENATEIHVANSSILYLLELLDLRAEQVHLYCRVPDETDFRHVDYLFSKPYVLHYPTQQMVA